MNTVVIVLLVLGVIIIVLAAKGKPLWSLVSKRWSRDVESPPQGEDWSEIESVDWKIALGTIIFLLYLAYRIIG